MEVRPAEQCAKIISPDRSTQSYTSGTLVKLSNTSVFQDIDWPNEWHPRIVFFNALEIEKMQKNHYLFYEEGNEIPFALETYRIKGSFRENLELWDFPLDYQVRIKSIFFV